MGDRSRFRDLAAAAGAEFAQGPFLGSRDPVGNRVEVVELRELQFGKSPAVLRGMGLDLAKTEKAGDQLADQGTA